MLVSKMSSRLALGAAILGALAFTPAHAQDAVKIGLILPMTGGQASTGKQIDNASSSICSRTATPSPARRSRSS